MNFLDKNQNTKANRMRKRIITGIFSMLVFNSLSSYAQESSEPTWIATTCTYYLDDKNKKPENTPKQFTFYVNDHFKIMKNANKADVWATFNAQDVIIQMQDSMHGKLHVVMPRKGYSSFKMYVDSTNQMLASGNCKAETKDKCELFPELCVPSSERGF